jgi:hypothetical protein
MMANTPPNGSRNGRNGYGHGVSVKATAVLIAVALVGVAGAVTATAAREPDEAFLFRQRAPGQVRAQALVAQLRRTDEPVPASPTRAVAAACRSAGTGELKNPWSCRVRYASGRVFRYRIVVAPDGSFRGSDPTGQRVVSGAGAFD